MKLGVLGPFKASTDIFAEFEKLRDPNKVFLEKPHPDDALRSAMEAL